MRWILEEPVTPPVLTLNCRGRLLTLERPALVGVLNLTPDSFSDGGQFNDAEAALAQVGRMLADGAAIIDVGGVSSRPGAPDVSEEEELRRLATVAPLLPRAFPDALFSIDTWRASVARRMIDAGFHIINDISAGRFDSSLFSVAAEAQAPLVLMHMQGAPATMQANPTYARPVDEVIQFLVERARAARAAGVRDLILDPGFGFGKTLEHNLELLGGLDSLALLGQPVLAGISRKRMVRTLAGGDSPLEMASVQGALHLQALQRGARLLRVHDVAPARRIVELYERLTYGTVHDRLP